MSADHSHLVLVTIGMVSSIGLFLLVYRRIHGASRLANSWTLGAFCLSCALWVEHLRLRAEAAAGPDSLAASQPMMVIPVLLFALGSFSYWHGVRRYLRLPTPWRARWILSAIVLAGVATYLRGSLTPIGLNAFRDALVAAVYGLAAIDFLRSSTAGAGRAMRIFSAFSAAVSLAFWIATGMRFLPGIEEPALEKGVCIIIIFTSCSGIFCAMLLFYETKSAELAALHASAIEQERELAETRTRQRISRSIHDSIAGANTSISLLATRDRPDSSTREQCLETLAQIQWLSNELGDDLHLVINGLDSPPLASRRWQGEVRHYTVSALSSAGIACNWVAKGFDDRPLGEALAVAEFQRSLKECVHNIIRHSQASAATFSLEVHDETLAILIEDDGVGIPAARPEGRGITGLRASAAATGGTFEIASSAAGTRLCFEIPLPLARR